MSSQIQKIIQTHQEHTKAQTQKNHTNPEIKHRKIIKEYCKKKKNNPYIYTNQIMQKKK